MLNAVLRSLSMMLNSIAKTIIKYSTTFNGNLLLPHHLMQPPTSTTDDKTKNS